jgi:hypothetical protein
MFRLISETTAAEATDADVLSATTLFGRTTRHVVLGHAWVKRTTNGGQMRTDVEADGMYLINRTMLNTAISAAKKAEKIKENAKTKEEIEKTTEEYKQALCKVGVAKEALPVIGPILITTNTEWLVHVRPGASVQLQARKTVNADDILL